MSARASEVPLVLMVIAAAIGIGALGMYAAGGREGYAAAARAQRMTATRTTAPAPPPAGAGDRVLCVRDAAGFASAAAARFGAALRGTDRAIDLAALSWIVRARFEADRWSELATGGPAVPQRVGTAEMVAALPRLPCEGETGFAQARIATPGGPAAAADPTKTTKPKPGTKTKPSGKRKRKAVSGAPKSTRRP